MYGEYIYADSDKALWLDIDKVPGWDENCVIQQNV
jgi:hypothetical protein